MVTFSGRGGRGFDSLMSPIYFLVFGARVQGARRPPTRPVKRVPTRRERAFTTRRSPTVSSGARARRRRRRDESSIPVCRFLPTEKIIIPPRSPLDLLRTRPVRDDPVARFLSRSIQVILRVLVRRAPLPRRAPFAAAAPRGPRPLSEHPRPPPPSPTASTSIDATSATAGEAGAAAGEVEVVADLVEHRVGSSGEALEPPGRDGDGGRPAIMSRRRRDRGGGCAAVSCKGEERDVETGVGTARA